jgi:ABC-2 type transport system permease protein
MLNPFALILQQMRHALVDPSYLTAAEAVGGRERLVVPLAIIVATWFVGYRVFKRAAPYVAERL